MFAYLIFTFIIAYFSLGLILYLFQNKFIVYPTNLDQNYPFKEFPNAEEIFLTIDAETKLNALYFKVPSAKGAILYFHGNARALDDWGHQAKMFNDRGYDVLIYDYRSFGKSTGKVSEPNMYHDAFLMYDTLLKTWDESQITLYGRSLGSGPSVEVASKMNPKQLILETPYTAIPHVAQKKVPIYPVKYLLKINFPNYLKIKKIDCPVHIFHGTSDELIPYQQAVSLAKIYGDPSILTTIDGGTHNNLPEYQAFHQKLDQLIP